MQARSKPGGEWRQAGKGDCPHPSQVNLLALFQGSPYLQERLVDVDIASFLLIPPAEAPGH